MEAGYARDLNYDGYIILELWSLNGMYHSREINVYDIRGILKHQVLTGL